MYDALYSITDVIMNVRINITRGVIGTFLIYTLF